MKLNLFLHFYVTLNVISPGTCSWNNIPIYQSELRDNFRKSPLGLGASTPLFIIPTDFRDKLWVELGSGVVTGLSLYFWTVMLIRHQQKKLIQEHILLGKIMSSTPDYVGWYNPQRLTHSRLLTPYIYSWWSTRSVSWKLPELSTEHWYRYGHWHPSQQVSHQTTSTHVYHCTSNLFWRNSPHWPFPAHRHLHQTEPRTRGDFWQGEFRVHSWMRPMTSDVQRQYTHITYE